MESGSPLIIIQMLKNVKQIIETSKDRDCWTSGELTNVNITYHDVCEIAKQLEQANPPRNIVSFEEITEDPVLDGPEPEPEPIKEIN